MPNLSFNIILAVFLGGGIGSSLRYMISLVLKNVGSKQLPWATFTANIISCLIMAGFLVAFSDRINQSDWLKALIVIGFCGGLSTFSTFSFETFALMKNGQFLWAIINVLISVSFCLLVFYFFSKKIYL